MPFSSNNGPPLEPTYVFALKSIKDIELVNISPIDADLFLFKMNSNEILVELIFSFIKW